jgi:cytochrome P450
VTAMIADFDPSRPELWQDPYPWYDLYRREDPVHWTLAAEQGNMGVWYLFSHQAVMLARADRRLSRGHRHEQLSREALPSFLEPYSRLLGSWMVEMDPPAYPRIRSLLAAPFTPGAVAALEDGIRRQVDAILDRALELGGDLEVVHQLAYPITMWTILQVLGLPHEDGPAIQEWCIAFAEVESRRATRELYERASQAALAMADYLAAVYHERCRRPAADLMSRLVREEREGGISRDEIIGNFMLLLMAGHETTVNLIGNAVWLLTRHPEQLRLLRQRPDLTRSAVSEVLRCESPVQTISVGHATAPILLDGKRIMPGQKVVVALGSANRDPAVFACPERFDITRHRVHHCSFGPGLHHCLGNHLALLETELTLGRLLQRTDQLTCDSERPQWRQELMLRGLQSLRLSLQPAR